MDFSSSTRSLVLCMFIFSLISFWNRRSNWVACEASYRELHNCFVINKLIVADLIKILTLSLRADQRPVDRETPRDFCFSRSSFNASSFFPCTSLRLVSTHSLKKPLYLPVKMEAKLLISFFLLILTRPEQSAQASYGSEPTPPAPTSKMTTATTILWTSTMCTTERTENTGDHDTDCPMGVICWIMVVSFVLLAGVNVFLLSTRFYKRLNKKATSVVNEPPVRFRGEQVEIQLWTIIREQSDPLFRLPPLLSKFVLFLCIASLTASCSPAANWHC